MTELTVDLIEEFEQFRLAKVSNIKPSDWAESKRIMTSEVSPFPGPFRYKRSPFAREIVDFFSPDHPGRIGAIMKGVQIGLTSSVIENAIGWIIDQNPGNILYLSGAKELSEEAMNTRIDNMIDTCGLRHLIRPNVRKKRNQRTGDTSESKEFPGGSLVAGSASNDRLLRQRSIKYGFIDDFDAVKRSTKSAGSIRKLIETRFTAYWDKMKLLYGSSPELQQTSNIEPIYKLGDQRKWFVTCPHCGEEINFEWRIETKTKEVAGITWDLNEKNELIEGSVKYRCQECLEYFDESIKDELVQAGRFKPTAEPSQPGYYSWHIPSLYATAGMKGWTDYVRQYLESCPPGGEEKEDELQTFKNTVLGETFEKQGKTIKASRLQQNIRNYQINEVPDIMSVKDGNGKILMLTCACDLNGLETDARLDYEVCAWTESGSSYSITHGSIGTFIPREKLLKVKVDREHWTYEIGKPKSVWPELEKVLGQSFKGESGQSYKILLSGVDCGYYTIHAYSFIDKSNYSVIGIKGDKENQYRKFGADLPYFKIAKERARLFLLDVNHIKDIVSSNIGLKWEPNQGEVQPPGFMNYPLPSDNKYLFHNYFSHYESEQRIVESKEGEGIASRWVKRNSSVFNHHWDIFNYNFTLKEIYADLTLRMHKPPLKGNWLDFVAYLRSNKKI